MSVLSSWLSVVFMTIDFNYTSFVFLSGNVLWHERCHANQGWRQSREEYSGSSVSRNGMNTRLRINHVKDHLSLKRPTLYWCNTCSVSMVEQLSRHPVVIEEAHSKRGAMPTLNNREKAWTFGICRAKIGTSPITPLVITILFSLNEGVMVWLKTFGWTTSASC